MGAKPNWVLRLAATAAKTLPAPLKRALYRVRPLANFLRGWLNRNAPVGLTEVTVAAGGLEGARLLLDLQDEKDFWLGSYEPELQAALADLVEPGAVAYDVGANIGYITLLLAQRVGAEGRVFAFEALPANVERLQANLSLNCPQAAVEVVPQAVVEASRPVRFLVGPSVGMGKVDGSAGRSKIQYQGAIEVEGISLDEFVYRQGRPAPQVVKMDIEGGEVLALPGMRRVLKEARPILFLELHGPEAAHAAWESLAEAGYRVCRMEPGYPEVAGREAVDWKAYLVGLPG